MVKWIMMFGITQSIAIALGAAGDSVFWCTNDFYLILLICGIDDDKWITLIQNTNKTKRWKQ